MPTKPPSKEGWIKLYIFSCHGFAKLTNFSICLGYFWLNRYFAVDPIEIFPTIFFPHSSLSAKNSPNNRNKIKQSLAQYSTNSSREKLLIPPLLFNNKVPRFLISLSCLVNGSSAKLFGKIR